MQKLHTSVNSEMQPPATLVQEQRSPYSADCAMLSGIRTPVTIRLELKLGPESGVLRNRIKELREAAGLAHPKDLAVLVGRSRSRISRIENGVQPAKESDLIKIAAVLGRHPAELITDDHIATSERQRELMEIAAKLPADAAAALLATARALVKSRE